MKMKSMKGEDLIKQIKEFCIEHGRLHEVGRHFPAVTFDALSEFFEGKILVDEKELREILEDYKDHGELRYSTTEMVKELLRE